MKTILYLFSIILCVALFQSCDDAFEFEGSAVITTEFRHLSSFKEIEIHGVFKSEVIYSEEDKIEITTNENIHDRILTNVNNDRLEIELVDGQYDNLKLDITIYTDDLERFIHNGVGDQSISGFPKFDFLYIQQNGVGNVTIEGSAKEFNFEGNDVGNLHGFNFVVEDCNIDQTGVGNVEVNCQSNLQGSMTGVGNLYYKGSPQIDVDITGIGKLINAN